MNPKRIKFKSYAQLAKLDRPYLLYVEKSGHNQTYSRFRLINPLKNNFKYDWLFTYSSKFETSCFKEKTYFDTICSMATYDKERHLKIKEIILL